MLLIFILILLNIKSFVIKILKYCFILLFSLIFLLLKNIIINYNQLNISKTKISKKIESVYHTRNC